jgi:hypothetical protein
MEDSNLLEGGQNAINDATIHKKLPFACLSKKVLALAYSAEQSNK